MRLPTLLTILAFAAMSLHAQTLSRRASVVGGGPSDRGKCTIEVVVDGAVDIELRGDSAFMRNLSGRTPEWRRFECNAPMPVNPVNFRFQGIDGRGRQELIRQPYNGSPAVIRIEDRDNGAEGYTFDVFWDGGGYNSGYNGGYNPNYRTDNPGYYGRESSGYYNQPGGFGMNQAIQVCEDAIRQQAASRFRTSDLRFRRTNIDDNPGNGRDRIVGAFEVGNGYNREIYRYSCSVNFNNGRVRSAQIEDRVNGGNGNGYGYGDNGVYRNNYTGSSQAVSNCQRAVDEQVRRDGYGVVSFPSINVDNRPGRNDWVVGSVVTDRGGRQRSFGFSCSVDLNSGDVRSVDVSYR